MLCFLLCTSLRSLFRHWVEFFHPVKLWKKKKKRFMDHKMWPEPLLMWWCIESGCTVPFKAGVFWTMKWSMQVSLVLTTLWWIVQRNEGKTLPWPTEEEAFLSVSAVLWQLQVWQSAAPPPRSHDHFLTSALRSHSCPLCPLQGAEQEPHTSGGRSDLPGSVQPGGAQAAEEQHQQADGRSLLGPGQDEDAVR